MLLRPRSPAGISLAEYNNRQLINQLINYSARWLLCPIATTSLAAVPALFAFGAYFGHLLPPSPMLQVGTADDGPDGDRPVRSGLSDGARLDLVQPPSS